MINKNEPLFVVDENNNPITSKPRQEAHANKYWHRVSHVWIINSNKDLLCQRRSLLKDESPGKWEPFFGGHLAPGVEYLEGAKIEIKEELGINLEENNLSFWKVYKNTNSCEFQGIFIYKFEGKAEELIFEVEEIDQIKWLSFNEVDNFISDESENNWSKMGYKKEILEIIKTL